MIIDFSDSEKFVYNESEWRIGLTSESCELLS